MDRHVPAARVGGHPLRLAERAAHLHVPRAGVGIELHELHPQHLHAAGAGVGEDVIRRSIPHQDVARAGVDRQLAGGDVFDRDAAGAGVHQSIADQLADPHVAGAGVDPRLAGRRAHRDVPRAGVEVEIPDVRGEVDVTTAGVHPQRPLQVADAHRTDHVAHRHLRTERHEDPEIGIEDRCRGLRPAVDPHPLPAIEGARVAGVFQPAQPSGQIDVHLAGARIGEAAIVVHRVGEDDLRPPLGVGAPHPLHAVQESAGLVRTRSGGVDERLDDQLLPRGAHQLDPAGEVRQADLAGLRRERLAERARLGRRPGHSRRRSPEGHHQQPRRGAGGRFRAGHGVLLSAGDTSRLLLSLTTPCEKRLQRG